MKKNYFIEKKIIRSGNSKAIILDKNILDFLSNPETVKLEPTFENDKPILKIFV